MIYDIYMIPYSTGISEKFVPVFDQFSLDTTQGEQFSILLYILFRKIVPLNAYF